MNYDVEIQSIKARLDSLQESFVQFGINNTYTVSKVDNTSNRVTAITPYTETKTAYIGDYQVLFENTPQGILTVSAVDSEGGFPAYVLEREGGIISVHFDNPLDYVTTVSISIQ